MHNFREHVPALVPGIVFLSGGQSEVQATENLNAINRARRAVAALVLVRPRAAGVCARGVGRRARERRRGPVVPGLARAQQQRRRRGALQRRDGGAGARDVAGTPGGRKFGLSGLVRIGTTPARLGPPRRARRAVSEGRGLIGGLGEDAHGWRSPS